LGGININPFTLFKKLSNQLRSKDGLTLLISGLVFASALISLYPGASILSNAVITNGFDRYTFDYLIADTFISLCMMLPSVVLFCLSYLVFESHSSGWKLLFVSSLIASCLGVYNYISLPIAVAIALPCTVAAFVELRVKNRRKHTDSVVTVENIAKVGMLLSVIVSAVIIIFLFGYAAIRGGPFLTWDFITNLNWNFQHAGTILNRNIPIDLPGLPSNTFGGIAGYSIGSLLLAAFCEAIAIPLGLGAAIYLSEYAKQNKITETIRFFIETLAGIPSVVIGLLGYVLLVNSLQWGHSLPSAALALAIMILPFNIRVVEEAMRSVPASYREGAYALGATQWETVRRIVLFAASPGIITGILLGLGAAIGESAVVYLTIGFPPLGPQTLPSIDKLFTNIGNFPTLPIFIIRAPSDLQIGQGSTGFFDQRIFTFEIFSVAFAAAFVLIAIYLSICALALFARNRLSRKILGK
jgi:phosphate transport system permease protein